MSMNQTNNKLNALWKRGTDFLGVEHAVMGGAMSWISDSSFVAAVSEAGGFGVIASGAMPIEMIEEEIKKTQILTKKPFGLNIITMRPDMNEVIDMAIKNSVSHVVLAGGIPNTEAISKLKDNKIKSIAFVPSLPVAKRLIERGIDALIIEGMEAGGHIGPVSTGILAQEIIPHIKEVPIFIAGGIGWGGMVASYLQMGASGCQLGTLLSCATESRAHPNFKKRMIKAQSREAVQSVQLSKDFPIIPVRALRNKSSNDFMEFQQETITKFKAGEFNKQEAQLSIEHFWVGSLKRAVIDGDVDTGSMMAGQIVGMVKAELPMKKIIDTLIDEAVEYLEQ